MSETSRLVTETTLTCTGVRGFEFKNGTSRQRYFYVSEFATADKKVKVISHEPLLVGKRYRITVTEAQ